MKKLNIEMLVGLFFIGGFLSFVYISLQFGEFSIFSLEEYYKVKADFNNISGLKRGAIVEIAGVSVGRVETIELGENDQANVGMLIRNDVSITEDAIASVKTQGIIGDKYIQISQGGSEVLLDNGDVIEETESAVDLEELVSKYIFGDI